MTKEEMQAEIDIGAIELWALEDLTQDASPAVRGLIASLHTRAALVASGCGFTLPDPSTRSGGGGK